DAAGGTGLRRGGPLAGAALVDGAGLDLAVGRPRLAAALVVELAAVVVGRVVRGGDVQPAVGLQLADRERQFRRGQETAAVGRQGPGVDAVGGVDAGGGVGEVLRGEVRAGVGRAGVVVLALVLELADVVGQHDAERLDPRETLLEVLAMSLDAGAEGPAVHAVGAYADGAAAAAGAERQDLVEAVEQA